MTMFEPQCRPIDQWPGEFTRNRKRAPFSVDYGTMMKHLERELQHIGAKSVVLLMSLEEHEIRIDGRPRAGANPKHPGVILVVETDKGTLRFPCDTYNHWSGNLRAIGLALDALRRVDRYGVTKRGEQYTGWKSLPSPESKPAVDPRHILARFIGSQAFTLSPEAAVRQCRLVTHPDKDGKPEDFNAVQEAARLLGVD